MRAATLILALAVGLPGPQPAWAEPQVSVVVHPSRAANLTRQMVRAIYLKQKQFWDDGEAIVPIHRQAGSPTRETVSQALFGQDSQQMAGYWNQRYFEAGEFPPSTLASDQAVLRFVAGNRNAIGYVATTVATPDVAVVLVLP